ncbi:MAG: CRISPR-associated endonuclease Cas2 [Deltaproteobacteria bacterium]|nr:CRISPR-associated endonuclease Cas2 [Deltaproteobacteria bacterium]
MYHIIVYDVEEKRVSIALKILRKYLFWVQNSVFEGELSDGQLAMLENELKGAIDLNKDSVIIYSVEEKWLRKKVLGVEKNSTNQII